MAALFTDEKCDLLCLNIKLLLLLTNAAGNHLGLVMPSTSVGARFCTCMSLFGPRQHCYVYILRQVSGFICPITHRDQSEKSNVFGHSSV